MHHTGNISAIVTSDPAEKTKRKDETEIKAAIVNHKDDEKANEKFQTTLKR